nr:Fe2+-enterobactin ABC transporter substrate-binding protein [Thaumasiovibrio subtropicus]
MIIKNSIIALLCLGVFFSSSVLADNTDWPRSFKNDDGTVTVIPKKPTRILSTSVSITGALLAIDTPVIGSATNRAGRWFAHWSEIADERGVEPLWPAGTIDIELVYALNPDLIIVSLGGADAVLEHVALLQEIAPTIVLSYGNQSWQSLAVKLGEATGTESRVSEQITAFNDYLVASRNKLTLPEGKVNIVGYFGPGTENAISPRNSSHAQVLTALGFDVEEPNPDWHNRDGEVLDFLRVHYETLTELTAPTTFLLGEDDAGARKMLRDPVMVNVPSVKAGQVYGLGKNSFRIDYFSALEMVDLIVKRYGTE